MQGDFSIRANDAGIAEAEDIFRFLERPFDAEGMEEASVFFEGSLQAEDGEFAGGAVDAFGVVGVDLAIEDFPGFLDFLDPFSGTDANQMVLKPPIGTFNLALGLRGERIGDIDTQIRKYCLPLHCCRLFGLLSLAPHRIPPFDEPEDGVVIDIILVGTSVSSRYVFYRADMGKTAFLAPQITVKQTPAVIVDARNQRPRFVRKRRPNVMGGVVLYQLPGVMGQYLPVVSFALRRLSQPIIVFFARSMIVGNDTCTPCSSLNRS